MKILSTEQVGRTVSAATLQRALVRLARGRKATTAKGWRRWWEASLEAQAASTRSSSSDH